MIDPAPALFGLLVGFLVGLTGVGGGSLMTPFLVAVVGVPAPTAVGTDLTFATLTKLTGSFQHFRQRSVNVEIAVFLGMGSIPAGLLGVGTLEWIKGAFDPAMVESIMMTIIAVTLVRGGGFPDLPRVLHAEEEEGPQARSVEWQGPDEPKTPGLYRLFGALGGYLVGLTSIGSGSVMAVLLLLLYPIAPAVIVGTDITHAMVLSFVVGIAHMTQGNVDFGLAGTLLLGSIPGVLIGSRLAPWIPGKPLKADTGHHADLRGYAPASCALGIRYCSGQALAFV